MHRLSLIISMIIAMCLFAVLQASAQQGQTLRIVKGKKVTLRADAEHALSYIWFHNGEPINGQHDTRIIVTEAGVYTVIALGDGCNSDLSDPVEIIVDPDAEDVEVDIEIRNLPDRQQALVDQEFSFQLLVVNKSTNAAQDVAVVFQLPPSLSYLGLEPGQVAEVNYDATQHELTWNIPAMEGQESFALRIRVLGNAQGEAVTMARVSSRQPDSDLANNESEARVHIIGFFIPNVFTPNGDGVNDTFEISGIEAFQSAQLRVFNRFGNEVYRSDDYRNEWTGAGLNEGTYFYYIELTDGTGKVHQQKGHVLILR